MKLVKVTMNFEFKVEDSDDDSLKEALVDAFEERAENDELLEHKAKIKITDLEGEPDGDPEIEEDEDEE